jgi:hypothetical protein
MASRASARLAGGPSSVRLLFGDAGRVAGAARGPRRSVAWLPVYPANLYPKPCAVITYCGCLGFGSIFWRSHATWTSTVRVFGIAW